MGVAPGGSPGATPMSAVVASGQEKPFTRLYVASA